MYSYAVIAGNRTYNRYLNIKILLNEFYIGKAHS